MVGEGVALAKHMQSFAIPLAGGFPALGYPNHMVTGIPPNISRVFTLEHFPNNSTHAISIPISSGPWFDPSTRMQSLCQTRSVQALLGS